MTKPKLRRTTAELGVDHVKVEGVAGIIRSRRGAWTADELAELLACSKKTIYQLAKSGRLPAMRIAGMVRFDPVATASWIEQRAA